MTTMVMPLLTTKYAIPPVRPGWIARPRLLVRLNEGLHRKLTLVSAPAGFGKTTLVRAWAQQSPTPVAWLSLDEEDNDPARFWAYVIAAQQTIHPAFGATAMTALQAPQPPPMDNVVTTLINAWTASSAPIVLTLDNLHVITNPAIHDAIIFMLKHMPSHIHLILASRADPPWPLARLRARAEMIEIRARDLRFKGEEATAFLRTTMGLLLSAEEITALATRTEGWIVGLQMAALALQQHHNAAEFIHAFGGSHRFILDYLIEEVLNQQTPDVRDFLLKTSILDRMSASLCEAVTGVTQSQTLLTRLDQDNLFLTPLDGERRGYRYHQLFADLLRHRLQQTMPEQVADLHRRAGAWYENQGHIAPSVKHALVAGDVTRVERLVAGNALSLIYHGNLTTVADWLKAIPQDTLQARPWLAVAKAWTLAYTGQFGDAEALLTNAENAFKSPNDSSVSDQNLRRRITGHIAAIRACIAALGGATADAAGPAREALDILPEVDVTTRAGAALMLGCALRARGDLVKASQVLDQAGAISRQSGHVHLHIDVLWEQATLHLWRGQLHAAMQSCERALHLTGGDAPSGGQPLPVMGYIYPLMAHIYNEWHDLTQAQHYAEEGYAVAKQWGQVDAVVQSCLYLANVRHAVGKTESALALIREAKRIAQDMGTWYQITTGAYEAWLTLMRGDVAAARRWVQTSGLAGPSSLTLEYGTGYAVLVRVLIAEGQIDEALELLARLLQQAEAAGAMRAALRYLTLQALAFHARGTAPATGQAMAALERALILAEPEGYVRVFTGEGEGMAHLLKQAAAQGIRLAYVNKLLATLVSEIRVSAPASRITPPLVEPLSAREVEVLRLLTTPLTSTEIAQTLFIAVSTARTHIKNIYSKLNVHTRQDAIQRAKDLGLLV